MVRIVAISCGCGQSDFSLVAASVSEWRIDVGGALVALRSADYERSAASYRSGAKASTQNSQRIDPSSRSYSVKLCAISVFSVSKVGNVITGGMAGEPLIAINHCNEACSVTLPRIFSVCPAALQPSFRWKKSMVRVHESSAAFSSKRGVVSL